MVQRFESHASGNVLEIQFWFISISKYKNLEENIVLYPICIFKILYFCFGNICFKFGSEAGASAFLGLHISDLDNSAVPTILGWNFSNFLTVKHRLICNVFAIKIIDRVLKYNIFIHLSHYKDMSNFIYVYNGSSISDKLHIEKIYGYIFSIYLVACRHAHFSVYCSWWIYISVCR